MTLYAAILYAAHVDWTAPEQADEMTQYGAFGETAAAVIRGGAALYPTSTATTVKVTGGKGGDVLSTTDPMRRPRRSSPGSTCWTALTSTRRCRWPRRFRRPGPER